MATKFAIETVFSAVNKVSTTVKKMTADVGGLSVAAERAKGALRGVSKVGGMALKGVGIVSAGVVVAGKSFIEAGAEVEKYKTTLETMLGSQEAANKRFAEYQKFNLKTPFELSEIVDLGNSLQALGRYSLENMSMLGDFAAASGKPVEQASRAFAKLASGQKGIAVDMFRDLLITTQDWVKATGKGVSKSGEMLATTEEMLAALPKILKDKGFAGMMENQSKTFNGRLSNMKDALFQFRAAMGSAILAPAGRMVEKIGNFINGLTDKINANSDEIAKYASKLFATFEKLFDSFITALPDIMKFGQVLLDILTFAMNHADVLLALAVGIKAVSLAMALVSASNPFVLAIAGLAALITLIVANWDKITGFFDMMDGINTAAGGSGNVADYATPGGAAAEMYGTTVPISSQTSTINRNTRNTLDVNFNNPPPGTTARATGPAAPPITVRTGSMRGAMQ